MSGRLVAPEVAFDSLTDRQWRWIEENPKPERLNAARNILKVVMEPSHLGYRPQGYDPETSKITEVTFQPVEGFEDGIKFLGFDVYGSFGTVSAAGKSVTAFVVHWPYPEFMTAPPEEVSDLFVRTLAEGELIDLMNPYSPRE